MAGGKIYGASNMTVLLQNDKLPRSSEVLDSLWIPNSSPTFHGSSSLVSFENACGADKCLNTDRSFFHKEEPCDDDYDGCFLQPGKKRRLSVDQVQFLEKSFEVENKLEPERKVQLAKELGLQPRQVAIWFQNRRARYKTKQLEKDYDSLKSSFDKLQSDCNDLVKENEKLKEEVLFLKDKLLIRDGQDFDQFADHEQHHQQQQPQEQRGPKILPEKLSDSGPPPPTPMLLVCKQEDASSAKSDVLDSDSPHYPTHSTNSLPEPTADSSNVFESDFSQDEDDDNFSRSFLSKLEDGHFHNPSSGGSVSSCNFGFPVEDQLFCFWP